MELLELEYLGLPYSTKNNYLQDFRAKVADIISTDLVVKQGRAIYSPISSWHYIACKYNMPTNYEFWEKLNLSFLKQCKKLLIVTLPGWETSIGLRGEIEFAEEHGIEIEKIDPQPYFEKLLIMDLEKARQLSKKLEI